MKPTITLKSIAEQNALGDFVISRASQFEARTETPRPSVKVVRSGAEHYQVNGRRFSVKNKRFLVVDKHCDLGLHIDDRNGVEGVCIFPSADLINEVAQTRLASQEALLEDLMVKDEIRLMEQFCHYDQNRTGTFLNSHIENIVREVQYGNETSVNMDHFFITLAECLVDDQLELEGKMKNLSSAKRATREELYRRVAMARDFITANYTEKLNLDDLVANACLSKYHFLRTFKAIYGTSPYQYLLNLRLQKAKELLLQDYAITEVNNMVGFSDVKNLRRALGKDS